MERTIEIVPRGPLDRRVEPPPSKSLLNRALAAAGLARGTSRLTWGAVARDAVVARRALEALGVATRREEGGRRLLVEGAAGRFPARDATLDLEDTGTGARLFTALAARARGPVRIDGSARLRERPVGPLVEALRSLGVRVEGDRLPLVVEGPEELPEDARLRVSGELSSQFVSALLLLGPAVGLDLEVTGRAVSRPYVRLTLDVMASFGVTVERLAEGRFRVPRRDYEGADLDIEADASSAATWLAAAAIAGGEVRVPGVPGDSLQPDRAVVDHLAAMGCETSAGPNGLVVRGPATRGADLDVRDSPDLVPVLAAAAAGVEDRTRLRGAPHLVHKESDRIAATVAALRAVGAHAEPRADGLVVEGGGLRGGVVDPRGDHRIAMAGAILGLRVPVTVLDPGCVAKSDPDFFRVLTD